MWDWLSSAWDVITGVEESTGSLWGDVALNAVETAVVGAGVGALTAAVTDKDISDGLLYGAAGGLVVGGLWELGKDFFKDFSFSKNQQDKTLASETNADVKSVTGKDIPTIAAGPSKIMITDTGSSSSGGGGGWWSSVSGKTLMESPVLAAGLQIGGSVLKGAFSEDPNEKALAEQKRQFDIVQGEEERRRARAETAASSFNVPQGSQIAGLSVAEQVKRKRDVGFSKEAAGVNTGGALVGIA